VPRGFYVLDFTKPGECDLAYFGLFEEIIGKGYGKLMMNSAFKSILEYGTVKTVTVNTNTLDHSNALPLYKKAGFKVTRVEQHNRKAFGEKKNRVGDLANV
jgi:GNAT superfamily N-acetyltransferase